MSRLTRAMSPAAMLISGLALVIATSSVSAYAAVKIGTSQLKNNAVTSAKIKNKTIKVKDISPTTVTALRGAPESFAGTILTARVSDTGSLVSRSGVSTVTRVDAGRYLVRFNRSVASCSLTATVNRVAADLEQFSIVALPQPTATDVRVVVGVSPGGSGFTLIDEHFSLVALCPR